MARAKKIIDPGPMLKQQFTIPMLPPTMNEIIALVGSHSQDRKYSAYNNAKREWDDNIIVILACENLVPYAVPVWPHFDFFVNKKMDYGNIESCQKFILDGMVKAELICSDSQQWCHPATYKFHPPKEDVAVIVTVSNYPMSATIPLNSPKEAAQDLIELFNFQQLQEIHRLMGKAINKIDRPCSV